MIEQTPLVVIEWIYLTPPGLDEKGPAALNFTTLDVMKKRAGNKKGIGCRFTNHFTANNKIYLNYVAEDSYVIDLADEIDKNELITMISNSYSKFEAEFNKRKFTTAFINHSLSKFDVTRVNLDAILPLLQD